MQEPSRDTGFDVRYTNREIYDLIVKTRDEIREYAKSQELLKERVSVVECDNKKQNEEIVKLTIKLVALSTTVALITSIIITFIIK